MNIDTELGPLNGQSQRIWKRQYLYQQPQRCQHQSWQQYCCKQQQESQPTVWQLRTIILPQTTPNCGWWLRQSERTYEY